MPDKKWISGVCGIYVVALFLPALAAAAAPDPDVLWWKFDEGTGTVAKDSSGKGHDGVITGVTWKSGGVGGLGYCLDFPGKSPSMVEDATAPCYLNGLGAITVSHVDQIPGHQYRQRVHRSPRTRPATTVSSRCGTMPPAPASAGRTS